MHILWSCKSVSEKFYQPLPKMLINMQIIYTKQNEVKYDAENWPLARKKNEENRN